MMRNAVKGLERAESRRSVVLTADYYSYDVLGSIEEVELGNDKGLDQHDRARCDDGQKGDYVDDSKDIKHDVASAGQGLSKAAHIEIDANS